MSVTKYRTLEDIQTLPGGVPEGLTLEYKSSDVLLKRQQDAVCKAVTAFANSVGGQLVLGVISKDFQPVGLDDGSNIKNARDWIFKVVNANVSPTIESFEVFEIKGKTGSYFVVDVPRSEYAPHQFGFQYYKRRGPHSEPMEHYEVEDVRNRPKKASTPLRMDVVVRQEVMFMLLLRNDHDSQPLSNLTFQIQSNFEFNRSGLNGLSERGLRSLRPDTELLFFLDATHSILKESPDAELTVHVEYEFIGQRVRDSFVFHLGDYNDSAANVSDDLVAMKNLTGKVGALVDQLDRLRRDQERLQNVIADGTGLRLSHRTLSTMRGEPGRFEPQEFQAAGYQMILDIPREEANKLSRVFNSWGHDRKKAYEALPEDLRRKFETKFRVEF